MTTANADGVAEVIEAGVESTATAEFGRAQAFLTHLSTVSGGREPRLLKVDSTRPEIDPVFVVTFDDVPEPGMTTGITYGVSLVDHPLWQGARPELCLTVQSTDDAWMWALGEIAEKLRGDCPFVFGSTVEIGAPITGDTEMTSLVVFAPAVLDRDDYEGIEVGEDDKITIVGIFPIHDSERRFIVDHGLEEFWQLGWDMVDVTRASMV
jgi:Suppressor of fused protein (SUFU)